MGAIKVESQKVEAINEPRLKELFAPCPICRGATDIDLKSHVFCFSCQQEWALNGEPIVENDGPTWPQSVGIDIKSSPEIESRLDTHEQRGLLIPIQCPSDSCLNELRTESLYRET